MRHACWPVDYRYRIFLRAFFTLVMFATVRPECVCFRRSPLSRSGFTHIWFNWTLVHLTPSQTCMREDRIRSIYCDFCINLVLLNTAVNASTVCALHELGFLLPLLHMTAFTLPIYMRTVRFRTKLPAWKHPEMYTMSFLDHPYV